MKKVWQSELDELIEVLGIKSKPVAVTFTNDEVESGKRKRVWMCNALKQAAKGSHTSSIRRPPPVPEAAGTAA